MFILSSYAIGAHFQNFIGRQVESGRYASAGEVIREALRLMEDQDCLLAAKLEQLRQDIRDGLNSGEPTPGAPKRSSVKAAKEEPLTGLPIAMRTCPWLSSARAPGATLRTSREKRFQGRALPGKVLNRRFSTNPRIPISGITP